MTVVHLLRHGEVHNPTGVLYGRLEGFGLSERGHAMARRVAEHLAGERDAPRADVVHVVASPLQRAQETAAPIAAAFGLDVVTDERVLEAENRFEGLTVGVGDGALSRPRHWPWLWNPFRPSWGEPYRQQVARMLAAIEAARVAAEGHEAVVVSHQLPVWIVRSAFEGRRLWHDPRKRECTLASLTSVHFDAGPHGPNAPRVVYTEPALDLLPDRPVVPGA